MMFSPGISKGGKGGGKDPSSPTQMEMGNVPSPPSTPSTGTRQAQGVVPGQQVAGGMCGDGVGNGFQVPVGNGFCQGSGCGSHPVNSQVPLLPGAGPSPFQTQNPGFVGPQSGFAVGGCTPQMQNVQQVLGLAQGLSSQQLMSLIQGLQEQVQFQGRMNPSMFGQVPFGLPVDVSVPSNPGVSLGLDGGSGLEGPGQRFQDVFSKSEKWIGSPPIPSFKNWVSRETEVIGWAQFVADLSGCAAQASIEFSLEIQQSCRWHEEISWDSMTSARRARAMRFQAILKSVFGEHPRTSNLINALTDGVSLVNAGAGLSLSQSGNGFEPLRQLTCEYSLRTRAEALALRAAFSMRSFQLSAQETSPSSVVTATIRKLDLESARFAKLISTLPSSVDTIGIQLTDSDLLLVLMRSLPDVVKTYAVPEL